MSARVVSLDESPKARLRAHLRQLRAYLVTIDESQRCCSADWVEKDVRHAGYCFLLANQLRALATPEQEAFLDYADLALARHLEWLEAQRGPATAVVKPLPGLAQGEAS